MTTPSPPTKSQILGALDAAETMGGGALNRVLSAIAKLDAASRRTAAEWLTRRAANASLID